MGRLACLSLPALPLQLLVRLHPDWKHQPAAVVAEEKSQGQILYVNRAAAEAGVRPGWRYGAGLSLVKELRAGVISAETVAAEVAQLAEQLQCFTPHLEPSLTQPGVFWLSAMGLRRVYPSLHAWAEAVLASVREAGFVGAIVVGFSRFGTYATARVSRGVTVFAQPRQELEAAREVSLARMALEPETRLRLEQLGIRTVGEFAGLPEAGILERFGPLAHRLHRMASGVLAPVLEPAALLEPAAQTVMLEYPEADLAMLLFLVKGRLHPLLGTLAARRQGLAELELELRMEGEASRKAAVRPAAPTLDAALIVDLVRLRLEGMTLENGVIAISLLAFGGPAPMEQLRLFNEHPGRDLRAGEQALARLRAEFGESATVRAELRDGHLPEAQFAWVPMQSIVFPALQPGPGAQPGERFLMRRLYPKAQALPSPERNIRDGSFIGGQLRGTMLRRFGPYPISGGWWVREVRRDYYYAETVQGEVAWMYYDRQRRQWFLQGRVE